MKIIRFLDSNNREQIGRQHDDGKVTRITGDLFGEFRDTGEMVAVARLLAPVAPADFFCIGLNYAKHAAESKKELPEFPMLFMKSSAAINNPGDPIVLPRALRSDKVDYEAELAVVIGKNCKNVKREHALDYVLGYTCANDVSARDWQNTWGGGQFCRGKTFDTFAPLGPCLVTRDEIPNPNDLKIRLVLNGQVMQDASTDDMIFDVPRLIEFLSGSTTLRAGTVILTGTPSGVGSARKPPVFMQPGDSVSVEIEKIGTLTNPVEEEKM